ncbi:MAG: 16S rRNA (uracil(1498)-N(3))-methyltransferase [Kiritimatiellae bacterium]|nr:16S rRNA (uracil(1498)-N(3))-methyltransferase [Kiritimatiellia bacterium]
MIAAIACKKRLPTDMHRCLIQPEVLASDSIRLGHEESRHLRTVLRVKAGDSVELFDGAGYTRRVEVKTADRQGLGVEPLEPPQFHARLPVSMVLFASVIKRMDWTVEKATELGVAEIVPVLTDRCVIRVSVKDAPAKVERWLRIAEDSLRQCGGSWLPQIHLPCTLEESLERIDAQRTYVAALSPSARPFRESLASEPPERVAYYVGPEGDFTKEELDALLRSGCIPVSLGPRVLRAETACLYGLSVLSSAWL